MYHAKLFLLLLGLGYATPLCEFCDCKLNYGSSDYNVHCTNNVELFDDSLWINPEDKKNHPFRSLEVENVQILTLDKEFPKSSLRTLILKNCSIDYINAGVFNNLQSLEELVLSDNNIETMHPKAFVGHYDRKGYKAVPLVKLFLDRNKIRSLRREIFKYTHKIEILKLSHNPLETIDGQTLKALNELEQLRKLDLSYTRLSSLPPDFLPKHAYLRYLDLSGNKIVEVPPVLSNLPKLSVLYLSANPMRELRSFPQVTSLKSLFLNNMPELEAVGEGSLNKLINLEVLDLSDNSRLGTIHKDALLKTEKHLRSWPPIRKLSVENSGLVLLNMELLDWDRLEELDLRNNPWSCHCGNRWMIEDLVPNILTTLDNRKAEILTCGSSGIAEPIRFVDMYREKKMEGECWTVHTRVLSVVHDFYTWSWSYWVYSSTVFVMGAATFYFYKIYPYFGII